MNIEKELYPIISDAEFRGVGFYNAVVEDREFVIYTTDRNEGGARNYGGEELIIEDCDAASYWVCAVKRDGLWRTPRPTYLIPYLRYLINKRDLASVEQR